MYSRRCGKYTTTWASKGQSDARLWPNGLTLSCAAPNRSGTQSGHFQPSKWPRSWAAQRRQLQRRVGPRPASGLRMRLTGCATRSFAVTLSRTIRLLEKVVVEPGLEMRVQCVLQPHHGLNHLGLEVRPLR